MKKTMFAVLALVLMVFTSVAQAAVFTEDKFTVDSIKIDGDLIDSYSTSRIYGAGLGENLKIELQLRSSADVKDAKVRAWIDGTKRDIEDSTKAFNLYENVVEKITLNLEIPEDKVKEGDYEINIVVDSGYSEMKVFSMPLKIMKDAYNLEVKNVEIVSTSGSETVEAGKTFQAKVWVENNGREDEEDVVVQVAIPELNIKESEKVDALDAGEEFKKEFQFKISADAEAKDYDVIVTVSSDNYDNEYFDKIVSKQTVKVVESKAIAKDAITAITSSNEIVQGTEAVYAIAITNFGSSEKEYSVEIVGADAWSTVTSQSVKVASGKVGEIKVTVKANSDAALGEKTFTAKIKADSKVAKEMNLTANVVKASSNWDSVKTGLEIGFAVLAIILVIIGLIIAFNKLKGDDEEEMTESSTGQTYY
ncbi:hypothetical protein J4403_01080 [Candidatus Woesearchaeota archaeon]|nr:hypothetical protein [Candidatus Woesearchaeota archaeon]